MAGTIGIKIANGDFYPIMAEGETAVKKRLVLTTVHDSQKNVQIDLYKSDTKTMHDALYIGTLVVEDIKPKFKGDPSIEMIISCSEDGIINAEASDIDKVGGEHNTLSVSLKTLEDRHEETPDFDFENKHQTPTKLHEKTESEEKTSKIPWLIIVLVALFTIIVIMLLWLFFFDDRDRQPFSRDGYTAEQTAPPPPPVEPPPPPPPPPPAEPPPPPPVEPPPPPPAPVVVEEVPVIQAPVTPPPARPQTVERKRPPAPVSSYKVPAVIPRNGVAYQLRWGDTLWDVAEAFYRDPWLYPRIARHNNIKNPDHIIAGRTIRIPPKN